MKNVRFLCLHPCSEVPREWDYLDTRHIINVHLSNCAFNGTESYEIAWKLTGRLHGMCMGFLTSLDGMYSLNRNTSTCDIGCNHSDPGLKPSLFAPDCFCPWISKDESALGQKLLLLGCLCAKPE